MNKITLMLVIFSAVLCLGVSEIEASVEDEAFLDKLGEDSFRYFLTEMNPKNGLIKDSSRPGAPCSIAAVGFGLTALCIGEARGWIGRDTAYERALQILVTFKHRVPHERGFFYHFLDMRNGKRSWNSEVSSIDTAFFLAGALFAGEYFKGTKVEQLARELYERVEWPWMMNGESIMCMGWRPEDGFLEFYWGSYSEAMILYALAIGSPTHPIDKKSWFEWKRIRGFYKDYEVIHSYFGSIFTYQYSHAWIDFRRLYDIENINYYGNSISAILANREFCIDNQDKHETYGENSWGLTACIGPNGYKAYGAKPGVGLNDGTIAPHGMAGSIVFAGKESIRGLRHIYDRHNRFLYGIYGFKDAFNLDKDWWAEEYLGIDVGITLLMIENYRSQLVWNKFMNIDPIKNWVSKCELG